MYYGHRPKNSRPSFSLLSSLHPTLSYFLLRSDYGQSIYSNMTWGRGGADRLGKGVDKEGEEKGSKTWKVTAIVCCKFMNLNRFSG